MRKRRLVLLLVLVAVAALGPAAVPGAAAGQQRDTIPADTLPADTVPRDTLPPDTLPPGPPPADTVPADTVVHNLPELRSPVSAGPAAAVWTWDREELVSNRAVTLAGLLEQVPGVQPLRGGDYGHPRGASAFASGSGGIRVFRDGVEMLPVEGSVPDLSRIGLGSLESVRLERSAAGLRIELRTLRADDPRPYSRIEAGTGDLDTNLLRGVFLHPRAMGGNVALALDRVDTQGTGRRQPGAVTSFWLRYSYLHEDRLGVVAEFNRSSSERDPVYVPASTTREDWTLRGRWRPAEGVVAELFGSASSLDSGDEDDGTGTEPATFPFRPETRGVWGGRVSAERGPVFARLGIARPEGDGLPDTDVDVETGVVRAPFGGLVASWTGRSWPEAWDARTILRGWAGPWHGFAPFGSVEDFRRGAPTLPPRPPEEDPEGTDGSTSGAAAPPAPPPRFVEGRSARGGLRFRRGELELFGARLGLELDSIRPLGLPLDRDGRAYPAGTRAGWEGAVRLPLLLLDGLALEGSGQLWDRTGSAWPYLPRRSGHAALTFHDTFLPTENLEVWFDVGVHARDGMAVPVPAATDATDPPAAVPPAAVPAYRSWYTRLQIRVVTVRVFATWENFTLRDRNQDFPGRRLPTTRAIYGVRWNLWN